MDVPPIPHRAGLIVATVGVVLALGALSSPLNTHHWWGRMALPAYVAAGLCSLTPKLRRWWVPIAIVGAGVVPLAVLIYGRAHGWHHAAQSEVDVIELAARRLVHHLTPYRTVQSMTATEAATHYSYFPYLPLLATPGLVRAVVGTSWWTDARVWLMAADLAVLWGIGRRVSRDRMRWVWLVLACPPATMAVAVGGHDILIMLTVAAAWTLTGTAGSVAAGAAASLTFLAWPMVIPTVTVGTSTTSSATSGSLTSGSDAIDRDATNKVRGRDRLSAFALRAVRLAVPVALTTWPILVNPPAALDHLVRFATGATPARSPADAPSIGHLLRMAPHGTLLSALGVAAVGVWFVARFLVRPPEGRRSALGWTAVGFLALIVMAPTTRFGYLVHVAMLSVLWWTEPRQ